MTSYVARRVVLGALAASVALPPASTLAQPTLSRAGSLLLYSAGSGDSDRLSVSINPSGDLVLNPFFGSAPQDEGWTIAGSASDCSANSNNTVVCSAPVAQMRFVLRDLDDSVIAFSSVSASLRLRFGGGDGDDSFVGGAGDDTATGDAGDDVLSGGAGSDTADGGSGGDRLLGGSGDDGLAGDAGADTLLGQAGTDALHGAAGRDRLTGGAGSDELAGGDGFDVALFSDRGSSAGVTVTIDDRADDGEPGEADNVRTDVEDVTGGAGADRIVGSGAGNVLAGGGGADDLDGGGGFDVFVAGAGDDTLRARDGSREQVDCGAGADSAIGDEVDVLTDCEDAQVSADLVPDFDRDGSTKPADCNDANGSIRPGAPEVPDNGVDENCDGADATDPDRDRDGVARPLDCDDTNRAIHPAAAEQRGNRFDENCDGIANPFPVVASTVRSGFTVFSRFTRITRLTARNVEAGTRITVRCRGGRRRGCRGKVARRSGHRRTIRGRDKSVSLTRLVRTLRLRAGARIEVSMTRRGAVGALVRIQIRRRRLPSTTRRCLPPGSSRSVEC